MPVMRSTAPVAARKLEKLEQLLRSVDQVAGAKAEEPHGERDERRGREADLLGLGKQARHGIPFEPAAAPPAAVNLWSGSSLSPKLPF
jgi:hypothetical protein